MVVQKLQRKIGIHGQILLGGRRREGQRSCKRRENVFNAGVAPRIIAKAMGDLAGYEKRGLKNDRKMWTIDLVYEFIRLGFSYGYLLWLTD